MPRPGRTLASIPLAAALALAACIPSFGAAGPTPQPTVGLRAATPGSSTPKATSTPQPEPAIVVTAPIAGQMVRSPVHVSGTAQVFEGTVLIAVKDGSGKVVGKGFTTASAGAPRRGTFGADISFTQPITSQTGIVEVYAESAKDGSVRDLVAIKVTLAGR